MKKYSIIWTLVLSGSLATSAIGEVLLTDTFSSTAGSVPSGWSAVGSGAANDFVTEGSLSIPGLESSTGGKWTLDNSTSEAYRNTFSSSPVSSGTTLYYSFVLQVNNIDGLSTTGYGNSLMMLNSATATTAASGVASVGIRKDSSDSTKFNLSFDGDYRGPSNASVGTVFPNQFSLGESIFIVVAYQLGTNSATSSASIWLNPSSSSFGSTDAPSASFTDTATSRSLIQSFLLATGTSTTHQPNSWSLDELRVGTTWADVTPAAIPEPSSLAFLAGSLALCAMTVMRRRSRR